MLELKLLGSVGVSILLAAFRGICFGNLIPVRNIVELFEYRVEHVP